MEPFFIATALRSAVPGHERSRHTKDFHYRSLFCNLLRSQRDYMEDETDDETVAPRKVQVPIRSTDLTLPATDSSTQCPICFEAIHNRTQVKPCGHCFDRTCIVDWYDRKKDSEKTCPLCRMTIRDIQFTFTGAGSHSEAAQKNLQQFGYEQEWLRLQKLPTRGTKRTIRYLDICIEGEEHYIHVTRSIALRLEQHRQETRSKFSRTMSIVYKQKRGADPKPVWLDTDSEARTEVENVQSDISKMMKEMLGDDSQARKASIHMHKSRIQARYALKSIETTREDIVTICTNHRSPADVVLVWEIRLDEKAGHYRHFNKISDIPSGKITDLNNIMDATQQIQGAFEYFNSIEAWPNEIGMSITNIFMPLPKSKCTFCDSDHRSGDCRLPGDQQPPIVETRKRFRGCMSAEL